MQCSGHTVAENLLLFILNSNFAGHPVSYPLLIVRRHLPARSRDESGNRICILSPCDEGPQKLAAPRGWTVPEKRLPWVAGNEEWTALVPFIFSARQRRPQQSQSSWNTQCHSLDPHSFFPPVLLRNNWHIALHKFKAYIEHDDLISIYCKMITTVGSADIHLLIYRQQKRKERKIEKNYSLMLRTHMIYSYHLSS